MLNIEGLSFRFGHFLGEQTDFPATNKSTQTWARKQTLLGYFRTRVRWEIIHAFGEHENLFICFGGGKEGGEEEEGRDGEQKRVQKDDAVFYSMLFVLRTIAIGILKILIYLWQIFTLQFMR